jgi:hypothetical protein
MPNLTQLKERLKQLPEKKSLREYAESFGEYTQKVARSREKLKQAFKDMGYISKAYPDSKCAKKILPLLKSSVTEAKKLHKEISEDPQKIKARATENKVVRLGDYASSATTQCRDIWNVQISNNVTKWEKLAIVVQSLGAKGGKEFKEAVDKLKLQGIPQNDKAVEQVKAIKKELEKGIAKLELEGPFGQFLTTAALGTASPRDLLNDKVKSKIDEYNLWDSFHVGL